MIITRQTDGMGYLFSDNRASHNGLEEADLLGCNHCQALMKMTGWKEDGGFCGGCGKPVCGPCADKILLPMDQGGGCIPFIRLVEEAMERFYRRQQNEKVLGI